MAQDKRKIRMMGSGLNRLQPALKQAAGGESWRRGVSSSTQRGYGYKWQQLRKAVLMEQPLCVFCQAEGRVTAACVVDHIVPHRGNPALQYDRTNLQPLCAHCHNSKKQKMENAERKNVRAGGG